MLKRVTLFDLISSGKLHIPIYHVRRFETMREYIVPSEMFCEEGALGKLMAYPKIFLVGEAPGAHEDAQKKPFVGYSGQELDKLLASAGIDRERDCYITNVVKVRPPLNDISQANPPCFDPFWLSILQAEIDLIQPDIIIALGATALNALKNYDFQFKQIHPQPFSILKQRGSIEYCELAHEVPGQFKFKMISTLHPAAILRQWPMRTILETDLKKASKDVKENGPILRRAGRHGRIRPTAGSAILYLRNIRDSGNPFVTDIELKANHISCIGIAKNTEEAMCIPFIADGKSYFTLEEEAAVWHELSLLFAAKNEKIFQNGMFDCFWLNLYGMNVNTDNVFDTMLAFNLMFAELPKGLDMLCSLYSDIPYYKDDSKSQEGWGAVPDEQLWGYNLNDCYATFDTYMEQQLELEEFPMPEAYFKDKRDWNLSRFYNEQIKPLFTALLETELRGIKVDVKKRDEAYHLLNTLEIPVLQGKLDDLAGHTLNPSSPKQVKEFLFTEMKLEEYTNRQGKVSTSEEVLLKIKDDMEQELLKRHPFDGAQKVLDVISCILEIRGKRKIASTYLAPADPETGKSKLDVDGRARCSYNIAGTKFGRLSSSECPLGSGANLQNIPPGICREVFTSDTCFEHKKKNKGIQHFEDQHCFNSEFNTMALEVEEKKIYSSDLITKFPDICIMDKCLVMVQGDLSQAEARVVAYIAEELKMIEVFERGLDIHKANAGFMFKLKYEDVPKDKRFVAKHLVHACNYKVGEVTFATATNAHAKQAGVQIFYTVADAKEAKRKYYETFPAIPRWHRWTDQEITKTRVLYNLFGRPHVFLDRIDDKLFREGYACIPQSTVADLTDRGLVICSKYYPVLLQVHDSVTTQVRPRVLEKCIKDMVEIFHIGMKAHGREFYIPMDFKVGTNWQNLVEVKI